MFTGELFSTVKTEAILNQAYMTYPAEGLCIDMQNMTTECGMKEGSSLFNSNLRFYWGPEQDPGLGLTPREKTVSIQVENL